MTHPATLPIEQLLRDCEETHARRSGPGGQHRNKVETAVILKHRPTLITAEANERRSQFENRNVAIGRLRVQLALKHRSEVASDERKTSGPSDLWRSRCLKGRLSINPAHEDFPALLAEALDVIVAADFDLKTAAELLTTSSSQLVKFLKMEPQALTMINQQRETRNLRVLL